MQHDRLATIHLVVRVSHRPLHNPTVSILVSPANAMANLLPNLPINFNLPPPPTSFPLSQLLANAISLGLPPPPTGSKQHPLLIDARDL